MLFRKRRISTAKADLITTDTPAPPPGGFPTGSNGKGYWGIKEAFPLAPLPSNEWEKEDPRVRDFVLDLSGAFLRIGISYGFSL